MKINALITLFLLFYSNSCAQKSPTEANKVVESFLTTLYKKSINEALTYLHTDSAQLIKQYFLKNNSETLICKNSNTFEILSSKSSNDLRETESFEIKINGNFISNLLVYKKGNTYKILLSHQQLFKLLENEFFVIEKLIINIAKKCNDNVIYLMSKSREPCQIAESWYKNIQHWDSLSPQMNYLLGKYFNEGLFTKNFNPDFEGSLIFLKRAYNQGYSDAFEELNFVYTGLGQIDEFVAFNLKEAKMGNIRAMSSLADHFENEFIHKNIATMEDALLWYKKAAEKGDKYSMKRLGLIYKIGRGVKKDLIESEKWYDKAKN